MSRKTTIVYYQKRIKKALIFIEKHLDDAIDLEQLAAENMQLRATLDFILSYIKLTKH